MKIDIPQNSDFTLDNLPFGIFSTKTRSPRVGVAIGDSIVDMKKLANTGLLGVDAEIFDQGSLNEFISLGKNVTSKVRSDLRLLLDPENDEIDKFHKLFVKQADVTMHMPVKVGDYTDFYSSLEHATNVGSMFRDPNNALLPNWKHLPVGYHGRASSIIVSGVDIKRPKGQTLPNGESTPIFQASQRLDFELEMGFIIGKNSKQGEPIPIDATDDYIFGMVLFNDWSARDIQKWEYIPLGPFLSKSFASSISPWIVMMDALEPFRVNGPKQEPDVLPYLQSNNNRNIDINLEVGLTPKNGTENIICKSNFKYMYWNMNQQLAHHTVNGCNVNVGDMMASGTISGKEPNEYGSMLELAWAGTKPLKLNDGSTRVFLEDGDTVAMRGYCEKNGVRVGFGEVKSTILPA